MDYTELKMLADEQIKLEKAIDFIGKEDINSIVIKGKGNKQVTFSTGTVHSSREEIAKEILRKVMIFFVAELAEVSCTTDKTIKNLVNN